MNAFGEIRLRARRMVVSTVGVCLLGYIAFHAVQGERGLLAWWRIQEDIKVSRTDLATAEQKRAALAARVALMRPESLNIDMVDEQVRRVLGLAHPDERLVLQPPGAGPRKAR